MNRVILHLDFDSFFASCEQQFCPELRNKPLGVTATNGRNCIIAASREAKKFGVETAFNVWEARRKCPDLLLTPAHFEKYWEISQKFVDIVKDYTPYVEVFSIDEVFMDVTLTKHLFGSEGAKRLRSPASADRRGAYNIIKSIKNRIRREIGEYITVSAGISYNKLLAKLASGIKKPDGIFEIQKENLDEVYRRVPLGKVCGIGRRILFRLNVLGIYSLFDLRRAPLSTLIHEFGNIEGHFLKNVGEGVDENVLVPYTDPKDVKSVGRQYCLPKNEYNQKVVLEDIFELCEEIGIKLRRLKKLAKRVGLGLSGKRSEHGAVTLSSYIHSGKEIFEACRYLYNSWNWGKSPGEYVRKMGIWVSNLEEFKGTQLSLFKNSLKHDQILKTIDRLNQKFGDHTIRNGFLLHAERLTTKPNGFVKE